MCCLKIIFLVVTTPNLIKKDTIGKEIEKRNKQNLFISQGVLLPEKWFSKTVKYWKLFFRWRQRERRRAMTLRFFLKHVYIYFIFSWI